MEKACDHPKVKIKQVDENGETESSCCYISFYFQSQKARISQTVAVGACNGGGKGETYHFLL